MKKHIIRIAAVFCFLGVFAASASAQSTFPQGSTEGTTEMSGEITPITVPLVDLQLRQPETGQEVAFSVQVLLLLTVLSLAPSILILVTSFLRFSIVLDFIKRALSLQQVPPTVVLNGIAFFMTIFIMWPTFTAVYNNSFKPLADGQINVQTAYAEAEAPLREFMFKQMASRRNQNGNLVVDMDGPGKYIGVFMSIAKMPKPNSPADVPTYVLIPAYILNELTIAFKIGVMLYIPFIIIDMVVASILMSMGMIMLPPVQISMPFKLMLFVLVDGWGLLTQQLFNSITL